MAHSASMVVPGIDDCSQWAATCAALDVFGVSPPEQAAIRQALSSVCRRRANTAWPPARPRA
jgi:myosin heavy subunit